MHMLNKNYTELEKQSYRPFLSGSIMLVINGYTNTIVKQIVSLGLPTRKGEITKKNKIP